MSGQTFASPGFPFYLPSTGVTSVSFEKNSTPPLAYLDHGTLYELDDGVLYFNGQPIQTGASGVTSDSVSSTVNDIVVMASTTGTVIKDTPAQLITSGSENILVGPSAGNLTYSGSYNTGLGDHVLHSMTSADENTVIGSHAGTSITTGDYNTIAGSYAGTNITTGSSNTIVGQSAAQTLTTGQNNIIIGDSASNDWAGDESTNIIIGHGVTGDVGDSQVIRIGQGYSGAVYEGPFVVSPITSSIYFSNVLIDPSDTNLGSCAFGHSNVGSATVIDTSAVFGVQNGGSLDTVYRSIILGNYNISAGGASQECRNNTLVTNYFAAAGGFVTACARNTCVGNVIGLNVTSASDNCIFGDNLGSALTTGSYNVLIGMDGTAGSLTTGSGNIYIGRAITPANESGVIRIGNSASATYISGMVSPTIPDGSYMPVYVGNSNQLVRKGTLQSPVITSNYPITAAPYDIYMVDTAGGALTITLPLVASIGGDCQRMIVIKDSTGSAGANAITIAASGGNFIDGAGPATINTNYGYLRFFSNGTNTWFTF